MILRFAGVFLIIIFFFALGLKASDRLKKYCESCNLIEEALNQIAVMIRYRSFNIYIISSELKKSTSLSKLEFIKKLPEKFDSQNFFDIWCNAVESDSLIGEEEKKLLKSFGENFGTSDIEGQLSNIDMIKEKLNIISEKRRSEYEKKGKLYRSIGLLAGIMTGILIL